MTITELIAALEAVRAGHGDCKVLTSNGPYGYHDDLRLDKARAQAWHLQDGTAHATGLRW